MSQTIEPRQIGVRYNRPALYLIYNLVPSDRLRRRKIPLWDIDEAVDIHTRQLDFDKITNDVISRHKMYLQNCNQNQIRFLIEMVCKHYKIDCRPKAKEFSIPRPLQPQPLQHTPPLDIVSSSKTTYTIETPKCADVSEKSQQKPILADNNQFQNAQAFLSTAGKMSGELDSSLKVSLAMPSSIDSTRPAEKSSTFPLPPSQTHSTSNGLVDLNKLNDAELFAIKTTMESDFSKNQIRKEDKKFQYDIKKSFGPAVEKSDWDSDSEDDAASTKPITTNIMGSIDSTPTSRLEAIPTVHENKMAVSKSTFPDIPKKTFLKESVSKRNQEIDGNSFSSDSDEDDIDALLNALDSTTDTKPRVQDKSAVSASEASISERYRLLNEPTKICSSSTIEKLPIDTKNIFQTEIHNSTLSAVKSSIPQAAVVFASPSFVEKQNSSETSIIHSHDKLSPVDTSTLAILKNQNPVSAQSHLENLPPLSGNNMAIKSSHEIFPSSLTSINKKEVAHADPAALPSKLLDISSHQSAPQNMSVSQSDAPISSTNEKPSTILSHANSPAPPDDIDEIFEDFEMHSDDDDFFTSSTKTINPATNPVAPKATSTQQSVPQSASFQSKDPASLTNSSLILQNEKPSMNVRLQELSESKPSNQASNQIPHQQVIDKNKSMLVPITDSPNKSSFLADLPVFSKRPVTETATGLQTPNIAVAESTPPKSRIVEFKNDDIDEYGAGHTDDEFENDADIVFSDDESLSNSRPISRKNEYHLGSLSDDDDLF
ncbi:hypothetical protein O5D80_007115 [Batrachochytrium dendrobatidis]|nr:hypothetical protein O5D80_007115 [Batrachochytrium dendrobatidis]